jgi:hypothetical protein
MGSKKGGTMLSTKLDRVRLDRAAFVAEKIGNPVVFRDKLAEIIAEDKEVEEMDKLPDVKNGCPVKMAPLDVKKGCPIKAKDKK